MRLFGREFTGFARVVLILVAVLLVSSGMCGLQLIVSSGGPGGFGPVMSLIGVVELAAILLSFVGLIVVLIVWRATALVQSKSEPTKIADQRPESSEDTKHDPLP